MGQRLRTASLLLYAAALACGRNAASASGGDSSGSVGNSGTDAGVVGGAGADAGTGTGDSSDAGSADGSGSDGGSGSGTDGASGSSGDVLAYTVTDLGPAVVHSIDARGRVAGDTTISGHWGGAVYTPGSGWSAVPVPAGADYVQAIGIDANDNVGMNAWFPQQPCIKCSVEHSYMAYPLRPVPFERHDFETSLINAVHPVTGHVVGYDEVLGGAYFYDGMISPIALQPWKTYDGGGPSVATALNVHDQVVGWMHINPDSSPYNSTPAHAFVWDHGKLIDLGGGTGAGGRCDALATGINDAALVVGVIDVGARCGEPQMFLWDGQMHVIGCPNDAAHNCWPRAINAHGDAVGDALISIMKGGYAFIYRDGTFYRLDELVDASGWKFEYAVGINDAGQIVGSGTLNGEGRAFVLTPR